MVYFRPKIINDYLLSVIFNFVFIPFIQMATKVRKLAKIAQRSLNLGAKKGEADRRILISRPKHLFAGKRKMGKTDRR